ncbi:hypothetical protein H1R20_g8571, partial [Candolleomyces eurysporus]
MSLAQKIVRALGLILHLGIRVCHLKSNLEAQSQYFPSIVHGGIYCGTSRRYGQLSSPSAKFVDHKLEELASSAMSSLSRLEKSHGIESLTWRAIQDIFDNCHTLCRSHAKHENEEERWQSPDFGSSERDSGDTPGDLMAQVRELVNGDSDVLANVSPDAIGILASSLKEARDVGVTGSEGAKCEKIFLNINVSRYLDLSRPHIKISRLRLIVSAEFKNGDKSMVTQHIAGGKSISVDNGWLKLSLIIAYNSSIYVPQPHLSKEAQRRGQEEIRILIPRK